MDWVAKGSQPGFPELIIQHLGAVKAGKVLQTLAFAKIFSLAKLKSLAPSGSANTIKRKIWTVVQSISTRHRLPFHLEEIINGIMKICVVTKFPNFAPSPRTDACASVRTPTLQKASALRKPTKQLFIKTVIRTPNSSRPAAATSNEMSSPRHDSQLSQSSSLSMNSFSQPKPFYAPRRIFFTDHTFAQTRTLCPG